MLPNAQDPKMQSREDFHFHHLVPGPAQSADSVSGHYEPVSCDFSDELEELSVKKLPLDVAYWDEARRLATARGRITDIFTSPGKEEFLRLDDGSPHETLIRLDTIMEVRTN